MKACHAMENDPSPPQDADTAFGQFVGLRLKAMTEERKNKCMSEILTSLTANSMHLATPGATDLGLPSGFGPLALSQTLHQGNRVRKLDLVYLAVYIIFATATISLVKLILFTRHYCQKPLC